MARVFIEPLKCFKKQTEWYRYGVTTGPDSGRVTGLDLSDNELEGNVPEGLGLLFGLESLDLSGNQGLVGLMSLGLMNLSRLSTLDIRDTGLCAPVVLEEWLDDAMIVFQGETCEEIEGIMVLYDEVEYEVGEGETVTASLVDTPSILEAESSPSISIELSPSHSVPMDTEIIGTITLKNMDTASYSSLIFRTDLTGFDPHYATEAASCEGEDMGKDIMVDVDESQETFTVRVYKACPLHIYAHYTLDASISRVDTSLPDGKVELASTSTQFSMSRYLMSGEIISPPPTPATAGWIDPDPETFEWYVGEWIRFRPRTDVLQYINHHVGVLAYGGEDSHFVSTGEATPDMTVEEACENPHDVSVHWRRAINQAIWMVPCRSGDAVIEVRHETEAVPPLYKHEFHTLSGQVTGVSVIEKVKQLAVSWNAITRASGYRVQWRPGDMPFDDTRQHVITDGLTTSYTIPNLTAGTEYAVRVIAIKTNANDELWSIEVIGTPEVFTSPVPPPTSPVPPPTSPVPPLTSPVPPPTSPVPPLMDDTIQEGESGGCAIASRKAAENTPETILFNFFLTVSVLLLRISRKNHSRGKQKRYFRSNGLS